MSSWSDRVLLIALCALAGCTTLQSTINPGQTADRGFSTVVSERQFAAIVPHMIQQPRHRIGLLLPLTGSTVPEKIVHDIRNAALMAMLNTDRQDQVLLIRDTGGTPVGARTAAEALIREGVSMILGPLLTDSVRALQPLAVSSDIPVITFSTEANIATANIYPIGIQPEQEIRRIVTHALSQGNSRFAALLPAHRYGDRLLPIFRQTVAAGGGTLVAYERYERDFAGIRMAVNRLVQKIGSVVTNNSSTPKTYQTSVDTILIADGGDLLTTAASLLSFSFAENRPQLLGVSLWDDPALVTEPSLRGGLFPSSPKRRSDAFKNQYETLYGQRPHSLAALGYDAVSLAAEIIAITNTRNSSSALRAQIERPIGFNGVNGRYRIYPGGRIEHDLEIREFIRNDIRVVR